MGPPSCAKRRDERWRLARPVMVGLGRPGWRSWGIRRRDEAHLVYERGRPRSRGRAGVRDHRGGCCDLRCGDLVPRLRRHRPSARGQGPRSDRRRRSGAGGGSGDGPPSGVDPAGHSRRVRAAERRDAVGLRVRPGVGGGGGRGGGAGLVRTFGAGSHAHWPSQGHRGGHEECPRRYNGARCREPGAGRSAARWRRWTTRWPSARCCGISAEGC
jgi:hypothetical protein